MPTDLELVDRGPPRSAQTLRSRVWWWLGCWRGRRVLAAALQIRGVQRLGPAEYRAQVHGRALTIVLVPEEGPPRLFVILGRRVEAEPASTEQPPVWEVAPFELAVFRGPKDEGFARVASPLHALALPRDRCWITARQVIYETRHLGRPRAWLDRLLRGLKDVVEGVDATSTLEEVLRHHAERSPLAAVRARATAFLLARSSAPEARRQMGIRALFDADPAIRLAGARAVGALGLPALRDLVVDPALSIADRYAALEYMVERFADDSLLPTLVKVACGRPVSLASAAVMAVRSVGTPLTAASSLLEVAAASEAAHSIRLEAIRQLGALPRIISAPALGRLRRRVNDPELLEAIEATVEAQGALSIAATAGSGDLSELPD